MLGEKWKELTDKDKEPYDAKAKADKERYEREKAEYAAVSNALTLPAQTLTDRSCRLALMMRRHLSRLLVMFSTSHAWHAHSRHACSANSG
jgi:hypothetical protein